MTPTRHLLALALAAMLCNMALADDPTPAEIKRFIADSRKATAVRSREIGFLLNGLRQQGDADQVSLLEDELRDYKRGKLLAAPLTVPLKQGAIGRVTTDAPVELVKVLGDDEALIEVRYARPMAQVSRNSKGVPRVIVSQKYQSTEFVLRGVRVAKNQRSIELPPLVYVVDTDARPAVIALFALAAAEKELPKRNWFLRPRD